MDPRFGVIDKRLSNIEKIISVASGKGGVGKSLVASTLALSFADQGKHVGLLDLDLYGPSSHIILGVRDVFPEEEKGIIPPEIHGIRFMSIVYFTGDKPSAFRGIDVTNIILELLAITQWGSLDYLIIDMPPGIGDETLDVIRYIKNSEFLIVTTPSKVAMGAVSKLLHMLQELYVPILGLVENMQMAPSPYIKNEAEKIGVNYLGSIQFDQQLESAIGNGTLLIKTQFMKQLRILMDKLVD
jgi:ATP-binding protein involved in chromosome partitioning